MKAFNIWSTEGIKVEDPGLKDYIVLQPKIVPRTGARYAGNKFHKSKSFIIERLINKVMVPGHKGKKHYRTSGHITGKSDKAYNIVKRALGVIGQRTKKNPIEVFVKALENGAPREEVTTIEYGGAKYPKSIETSPQRRIDIALRYMVQGAYQKSFNAKKSIEECLADEIMNAYTLNPSSSAIKKKQEMERQADSAR